MSQPRRILVVDDESQITRVLRTTLSSRGYDLRIANDGETALEIMKDWSPDLVITDLSMPNLDGLELCRRLRTYSQVPIIVLSVRGEERTKVQALDAGADDYVTKPFSPRELVARVRAVLRRARESVQTETLKLGSLEIDAASMILKVGDRIVPTTTREFRLLDYLARHSSRVFTRDQLLDAVWSEGSFVTPRSVDVYVRRLREKIEPDAENPSYLKTVRGIGYRFDVPK